MNTPMRRLAKEIENVLAGPPALNQTQFAQKCGMTKSKLSRILSGRITCDQHTVDVFLAAATDRDTKRRMVEAYIRDIVSPLALELLRPEGVKDPFQFLDLQPKLTPRCEKALKALLHSPDLAAVEHMIIGLANIMDKR
jgi:hypothetical protein